MTTRKGIPKDAINSESVKLSEILQGDSDSVSVAFGDTDGSTIRRLNHTVGELGGMVTYWVDSVNGRLCFSVRVGSEKRSYQAETGEQFNRSAEAFIEKLLPALGRLKKRLPPKL